MISAEAAKGDIEKLIEEAKSVTVLGAAVILVLRGVLVAIKVILTCRSNTVAIMDFLKIPKNEVKKEEPK
jgi:hypothetical protein